MHSPLRVRSIVFQGARWIVRRNMRLVRTLPINEGSRTVAFQSRLERLRRRVRCEPDCRRPDVALVTHGESVTPRLASVLRSLADREVPASSSSVISAGGQPPLRWCTTSLRRSTIPMKTTSMGLSPMATTTIHDSIQVGAPSMAAPLQWDQPRLILSTGSLSCASHVQRGFCLSSLITHAIQTNFLLNGSRKFRKSKAKPNVVMF